MFPCLFLIFVRTKRGLCGLGVFSCFLVMFAVVTAPARILRSPCPRVFAFEKVAYDGDRDWVFPSEDHQWRGVISVAPSLPIFLKVKLLTPAALPSQYVGRIELAEDKIEILRKINSGSLDKIRYHVYFPAKVPVPEVIRIEVNSQVVCSRPLVPRRVKTILTLEHSLMPITGNVTLRGGIGMVNSKPEAMSGEKPERLAEKCGRSVFSDPMTTGNFSVSIGDWPWMVPLFKKTELGLQFLCSSTLVSYEFAVTAAHCVKFKSSGLLRKEDIVAYAGRVDITNWTEESTQPRELSDIFVHPDFDSETLHSDLAIIKFSKPVKFSHKVNPACLWRGNADLDAVVGKKGIVFGWGSDGLGRKITSTPRMAVMPIASQEECLRSKVEFLFLTSNRTLCAGFRNGPCSGDSGGGLLLPTRDEDGTLRWVLRGVVSLSLLKSNRLMCDVDEFTVFTDVAKYQGWLSEKMRVRRP